MISDTLRVFMMGCLCFKRKGDLKKFIPFYVIGGILIVAGLPLMLVGIIATFTASDLVGYVGGISVFIGLLFMLIWHMVTIPNLSKHTKETAYEAKSDIKRKHSSVSLSNYRNGGQENGAYEKSLPGIKSPTESYELYETANKSYSNNYEQIDVVQPKKEGANGTNTKNAHGYDNPGLEISPATEAENRTILTVESEFGGQQSGRTSRNSNNSNPLPEVEIKSSEY